MVAFPTLENMSFYFYISGKFMLNAVKCVEGLHICKYFLYSPLSYYLYDI